MMFSKIKNKFQATRFEFTLQCHSLQPWPVGNKAIAIGWQRGKRRRGATNSVVPLPSDKSGTVVRINEKFTCPATMYKAPGADKNSPTGPYKKKCIILAVLETDGRSNATAALGRVVIDLSEFVSIDGQELRTFQVACNKSIHAAVGQPQLTITIRCRWKKAGADMTEDEVASMSTDTTGSNLAGNWLGNILSFGKGLTSSARSRREYEQDLTNAAAPRETMDTIGEEDGDGGRPESPQSAISSHFSEEWQHAEQAEYDVAGTLNLHDDDDYQAAPRAKQLHMPPAPSTSSRATSTTPAPGASSEQPREAGKWRLHEAAPGGSGNSLGPPTPVPAVERARKPRVRGKMHNKRTQTDPRRTAVPGFEDGSALQDELLTAAALELALYNSEWPLVQGRAPGRTVHAAARRLARTLVCLGRQDGLPFGAIALAHIRSRVLRHRSDVGQLAYWWTTACHLRGFLQSLNLTVAPGAGADESGRMHWASMTFVPQLLSQEKFIFDELVAHMWTNVLVPRISTQKAAKGSSAAAPLNKRAAHEAALRKWVECFDGVNATLKELGRQGHVATLRHQVLLELLKRTDVLMFHYLINPAPEQSETSQPTTPASSTVSLPDSSHARGSATGMPLLDDSMLFFGRGNLTFGAGMTLKMAAARFQQWAFSEGGLKEIWSQLPEKGQALFALLRGAADLLMMPKDMLLDEGIRSDMVDNLPLDAVLYIVEHFHADEYAADRIPHEVTAALRESVAAKNGAPLPAGPAAPPVLDVEGECTYYSPTDDMVMEKVEVGEEPGLEYDDDSEDELEALGTLCSAPGAEAGTAPALRFKLLHNLWSAGVPRSRRVLSGDD